MQVKKWNWKYWN